MCIIALFSFSLASSATSQHFGFVGSGTLFLLQIGTDGSIVETKSFEWSDGLFDIVSKKFLPPSVVYSEIVNNFVLFFSFSL